MTLGMDYNTAAAAGVKALERVHGQIMQSGLPKALVDLVTVEKLVLVPVWREVGTLFDDTERAALAWAETVTRVAETHVPDVAHEAASAVFDDKQLADLTIAIGLINTYNRLAISFRDTPAAAKL